MQVAVAVVLEEQVLQLAQAVLVVVVMELGAVQAELLELQTQVEAVVVLQAAQELLVVLV
jgi:hypothetical protein